MFVNLLEEERILFANMSHSNIPTPVSELRGEMHTKCEELFSGLKKENNEYQLPLSDVTVADYMRLLPWYFDTNANMLTIRRLAKIHKQHLLKQKIDKEMFVLLKPLADPHFVAGHEEEEANKQEEGIAKELKDFVSDLKQKFFDVEMFLDCEHSMYYLHRISPISVQDKVLLDKYLPTVSRKTFKGEIEQTKYPQNHGELSEILAKIPKDQEFCIAGTFTNHATNLKWKNVKRLHIGDMDALRELPADHPLEEIVYSFFHYESDHSGANIPPVKSQQWLWEKPVKLTLVYHFDSEMEEYLLPNVDSGLNLIFEDSYDTEVFLRETDLLAGKDRSEIHRLFKEELKKTHPMPTLRPYKEEEEEEEEEKEKANSIEIQSLTGIEYTNEIHVPDDSRISSVEMLIYCENFEPRSKLMNLMYAKLVTSLRFGNRDMSTVKFTVI